MFKCVLIGIGIAALIFYTAMRVGSPYFVAYKASRIAQNRPYCILLSNDDTHSAAPYKTVTRKEQLAFRNLTARLVHTWGSRGFYSETNYALLVLDDPREYMNWSFRALDFVHEPLINITHGIVHGKPVSLMQFEPCAPSTNFVGNLP